MRRRLTDLEYHLQLEAVLAILGDKLDELTEDFSIIFHALNERIDEDLEE